MLLFVLVLDVVCVVLLLFDVAWCRCACWLLVFVVVCCLRCLLLCVGSCLLLVVWRCSRLLLALYVVGC